MSSWSAELRIHIVYVWSVHSIHVTSIYYLFTISSLLF